MGAQVRYPTVMRAITEAATPVDALVEVAGSEYWVNGATDTDGTTGQNDEIDKINADSSAVNENDDNGDDLATVMTNADGARETSKIWSSKFRPTPNTSVSTWVDRIGIAVKELESMDVVNGLIVIGASTWRTCWWKM
ncbi:hypothetical protein DVH05_012646 [Phytophthora capsici]|nr:hypothetical protein DVH05_012646 [Phytophthora capsici]